MVRLIGATTHNPFFFVNSPLVSRSQIFELRPLTEEDFSSCCAAPWPTRSAVWATCKIQADEDALRHLAKVSDGDARKALNSLEIAALTTPPDADGVIPIDLAAPSKASRKRRSFMTGTATRITTPFPPSSSPCAGATLDAALYWLAKMIHAGEDPRFITRRIMICAAEDVGLADPMALVLADGGASGGGICRLAGGAHSHCGGDHLHRHGQQEQQRLSGH